MPGRRWNLRRHPAAIALAGRRANTCWSPDRLGGHPVGRCRVHERRRARRRQPGRPVVRPDRRLVGPADARAGAGAWHPGRLPPLSRRSWDPAPVPRFLPKGRPDAGRQGFARLATSGQLASGRFEHAGASRRAPAQPIDVGLGRIASGRLFGKVQAAGPGNGEVRLTERQVRRRTGAHDQWLASASRRWRLITFSAIWAGTSS